MFLGGDHVTQVAVAEGVVAGKVDLFDLRLAAFIDFEHEVDAVFRQANEFGCNTHIVEALLLVNRKNALGVGGDAGLGVDDALAHLHFLQQGIVVNILVAFNVDQIDQRIFGHGDNQ